MLYFNPCFNKVCFTSTMFGFDDGAVLPLPSRGMCSAHTAPIFMHPHRLKYGVLAVAHHYPCWLVKFKELSIVEFELLNNQFWLHNIFTSKMCYKGTALYFSGIKFKVLSTC